MDTEFDQPDYEDASKQPKTLTRSRHIDNVLYVAGRAPREKSEYEIMFITTAVEEDEANTHAVSTFGFRVSQPAEYLKGANGVVKDVALMAGVDMEDCYYTAVCKWLLPRAQRARPSKKVMKWGMPILEDEIARIKPKIIVCLGKPVFDIVGDQKVSFKDAHGCWFWNEQHQAHMYVMYAPYTLVGNPEHYETFRIDFKEIARRRDILRDGGKITGAEVNYQVIDNEADLREWLERVEELAAGDEWPGLRDEEGNPILSVDCEWHGKTHVDGQLRTIQFAWSETEAVVIEFRNEQNQWSFELAGVAPPEYWDAVDVRNMYADVGKPIAATLERMGARFIGHHFAADAPWMQHWLGIETYEKCVLDTEFAQQTCDESSELGLERGIALKYTNLGRYDQDLVFFKRDNKELCKGGYGYIPSAILHPYACLRNESKVQLGDGSWAPIGKLVREKYSGTVRAKVGDEVRNCKVTGWHRADVRQKEWFKLVTATSTSSRFGLTGPAFTPDHEVITQRGKVRVDQLKVGEDKIVTDEPQPTADQISIILGSLLGDGGVTRQSTSKYYFKFSQYGHRVPYAEWKASALSSAFPLRKREDPESDKHSAGVGFVSPCNRILTEVLQKHPRHKTNANRSRKLVLTRELLRELGRLGYAVWYQDDGSFTPAGCCSICCTKLTDEEIAVTEEYLDGLFGGVQYDRKRGELKFTREASKAFLAEVAPLMHPAMQYKSDVTVGGQLSEIDVTPQRLFVETVLEVVPSPPKNGGGGVRYCLTVEEAGNFLTKVGFVSNCKDVITPIRAYPLIKRQLEAQRLWDYYRDIFNPFVTDVFTEFAMTGLPMDIPLMDDLRRLFTWTTARLNVKLQERIATEAVQKFKSRVMQEFGVAAARELWSLIDARDEIALKNAVKELLNAKGQMQEVTTWNSLIHHLVESPRFNIRSPDQMARWLFDFEGLTPIKSTNQKAKGLPSMAWEKVLELPKDRQALYKPAVDKQTLAILSEQLPAIDELLNLNAVGNLSKAFLNEPDVYVDGDTGEEVVEEHGLHAWLCSDETKRTKRPNQFRTNKKNEVSKRSE